MKFDEVENIDSHVLWLASEWYRESDWPVRFAIRLMYTDYWSREWARENGPYHVEVLAAAPSAPTDENLASVLRTIGRTVEEFRALPEDAQVVTLAEVGAAATLWQETGRNKARLLKAARAEMAKISILFGFYMDRRVNAIGNTSWDAIRADVGYASAARNRKE